MKITLQLFGAFREFGESLTLSVPQNALVADARKALANKLKKIDANPSKIGLISISRFATETRILSEKDMLQDGAVITIIAPVSGG